MLAKFQARQRHQRLMRAAHNLLREAHLAELNGADKVTPEHLASYVFGRFQLDIDEDEAQRYLSAARVSRGLDPKPDSEGPLTAIHHSI